MQLKSFQENGCTYYQLYASCPECLYLGKDAPRVFWKHDGCGGDMYVGDNAFYKCVKCGYTAPVVNWGYSCPNHSGDTDCFMKIKAAGLVGLTSPLEECVAIRGMLLPCGLKWIQTFCANLSDER